MDYLFVDLGTYSVKFLETRLEKGKISPKNIQSIVISEVLSEFDANATLEDIQLAIVKSYLDSGFEGKLTFQLSNDYVTSRYINLPVPNRRKAEMMIPFQLDDQLPYPISFAHFASQIEKVANTSEAIINVSKSSEFEHYYFKMQDSSVLPNVLTTELAAVNSFIKTINITYPYAIIDIGHSTTKAYFVLQGKVVSNHVSYLGGRIIDSVISKTYDIPLQEAVTYKHQNCFFLTENQYDEVDKDQKEFANLMKQTIWPLVKDLKRWDLGHRVNYGEAVEKYFIMGGTSNIKNISNFLSQAIESKVEHLSVIDRFTHLIEEIEEDESSYSLVSLMTAQETGNEVPLNMLHGKFSNNLMGQVPLYSAAFIASRVSILSVVVCLLLIIERVFFLSGDIKKLDREIMNRIKSPNLGITRAQRTQYRKAPDRILEILERKNKTISQEISSVMSATKINAVSPLIRLSQIVGSNPDVQLDSFNSQDGKVSALLTSKNPTLLQGIKTSLEKENLKDLKINLQASKMSVDFNYDN